MKSSLGLLVAVTIFIGLWLAGDYAYKIIYTAGYSAGVDAGPPFDYDKLAAQLNDEAKHLDCNWIYGLPADADTPLKQFPEGGTILFRGDHMPRGSSEVVEFCMVSHKLLLP